MRLKSHLPPICFESPVSGKTYIVCTGKDSGGWIEVNRWYGWAEIEKMWDRIDYGVSKAIKKQERKEYKVSGSKGNVYSVVNNDGSWSCSCPAFGWSRGKDCKHIKEVKK